MTRILLPMTAFMLVALLAVGATCLEDKPIQSPELQLQPTEEYPDDWRTAVPTFFPTPGPTLPWDGVLTGVAESVDDAASFAREQLMAMPPFVVTEPQSLTYVRATVGDARDLFDPDRDTAVWDTPDDVPAVIFVAYGEFQWRSVPGSATPGPAYNTVWVVVPLGVRGTHLGGANEQYDLTALGEVGEVRVPLPPFPTPVEFRTRVDGS